MKLVRLGLVVVIASLFGSSTYGAIVLTANYSLTAVAHDLRSNPSIIPPPSGIATLAVGGVTNDPDPGPIFFSPEARAEHGDAVATIDAKIRAQAGSIGVGMFGFTNAPFTPGGGPPGTLGSGGEARIQAIQANAGWAEGVVPNVRNKPLGQPIIFNTLLALDGTLSAIVGGGSLGVLGNAHVTLEFFEQGGNPIVPDAPFSDDPLHPVFARLVEDPLSQIHILDVPPRIIRVTHIMSNKETYHFSEKMSMFADARAIDGGLSSFSADFSASLKWGGIESVTDTDGNLIPREDWSIESESGFDYSKPFDVPEPSTVLLLVTGLCTASTLRRRRCALVRSE